MSPHGMPFCPTLAADMGEVIPVLVITIGGAIAMISIIMGTIRRVSMTKQVEMTRREIAAYVAEGSMSADDGYKLIAAGKDSGKDKACC